MMLSYSARRLTRLLPALAAGGAQTVGVGACSEFGARSVAAQQTPTSAPEVAPAVAGQWQQWRGLAGRSSGSGSDSDTSTSSSDSSATSTKPTLVKGRRREGSWWISHEPKPQPQLQAWLQQEQGLQEAEADDHARRLSTVFGGDEAAALASLPATFAWCHSQGLSGLQTAKVLGRIAGTRQDNVVNFATTAQLDWLLIDGYIRANFQRQQQAAVRLSKHASFASLLVGSEAAAAALKTPPGHVAAWLAAVGQLLTAADLGAVLASSPIVVIGELDTALGAINWAASKLKATSEQEVMDLGSFFRKGTSMLMSDAATLQGKLDNLQQAAGLTAEEAWQLACKWPRLLHTKIGKVRLAAQWLQHFFPATVELLPVLRRGSQLLVSAERLQGNADALQQQLGWSHEQVVTYIQDYPQPFARVDLSGPDTAAKLRFLTQVLGVASDEQCIADYGNYLRTGLDTMVALYLLVLALRPALLRYSDGTANLSWIINAKALLVPKYISAADFHAHVRDCPKSHDGARLLANLRSGSIAGWQLPGEPAAGQPASTARRRGAKNGPAAAAAAAAAAGKGRQRKQQKAAE